MPIGLVPMRCIRSSVIAETKKTRIARNCSPAWLVAGQMKRSTCCDAGAGTTPVAAPPAPRPRQIFGSAVESAASDATPAEVSVSRVR